MERVHHHDGVGQLLNRGGLEPGEPSIAMTSVPGEPERRGSARR
jgi:hypothetical protein